MALSAAANVFRAPKGRETYTLNQYPFPKARLYGWTVRNHRNVILPSYLRRPSIEGMRSKLGSAGKM